MTNLETPVQSACKDTSPMPTITLGESKNQCHFRWSGGLLSPHSPGASSASHLLAVDDRVLATSHPPAAMSRGGSTSALGGIPLRNWKQGPFGET